VAATFAQAADAEAAPKAWALASQVQEAAQDVALSRSPPTQPRCPNCRQSAEEGASPKSRQSREEWASRLEMEPDSAY